LDCRAIEEEEEEEEAAAAQTSCAKGLTSGIGTRIKKST
jgi:hypothetical protein